MDLTENIISDALQRYPNEKTGEPSLVYKLNLKTE